MSFKQRNKKMYRVWVVISILAVLSMIAFTIAPLMTMR
jgi:hypothetical protein